MTRGGICCIGCKEYRPLEVKQQQSSPKSNPRHILSVVLLWIAVVMAVAFLYADHSVHEVLYVKIDS